MLWINNSFIMKDLKCAIHVAKHNEKLKAYLMTKYGWSEDTFKTIDWASM